MSNNFQLRVAELICSRICHDLISPLSAINNGLELLNESGDGLVPDLINLIGSSTSHALDRLSFYRTAYGSGGEGMMLSLQDVKMILHTFAADRKTEMIWIKDIPATKDQIPKVSAKLLTNVFHLQF